MPNESEIIALIRSRASTGGKAPMGVGDDAAVITPSVSSDWVVCSDLSVEGVHFRTEWASPAFIGRKALAVTLSDVSAMGAAPRFALLSLALPAETAAGFVEELIDGIFTLANATGVAVIGGDTSSSPGPIYVDTVAIGECPSGKAVPRGGARAGDAIYVTGSLGASALGLRLLKEGRRLGDNRGGAATTDSSRVRSALLKHLAPNLQVEFGKALGESGLATAMIDISDGLSTDLSHILAESECGAVVRADAIPIAESVVGLAPGLGLEPLSLALHGGEEYELLFTVSAGVLDEVESLAREVGVLAIRIGEIVEGSGLLLDRDGKRTLVAPGGYEHKF